MMAMVYDWTGFYVGGNVGAIGSTGNSVHQCVNPAGVTNGALCDVIRDTSLNGTGFIGGAQAGYNWQMTGLLFGLEGDIQGTTLKSSTTITGAFPLTAPPAGLADPARTTFTNSERLNWLATVRGRIGYTAGDALFYATGGVQTATNLIGLVNSYPSTTNSTRAGWTAGGGVEWGFAPQWSTKFEGLYYDLGTVTSLGTSVSAIVAFREGSRISINGWTARAGVNYRFGSPGLAKY